jgi:hypothetical protein
MTAQVANTGIVGSPSRIAQPRHAVASASGYVDSMFGAFAPATHDQASLFNDGEGSFETPRRQRRYNPYQDQVVSFGGVLVSREVGATIMKEQAALAARGGLIFPGDAERSIAIYEFNQSLVGVAEAVTDASISHS